MTGGILQIVSTNYFDKYLTINPKITFYESVYCRHTSFYKYTDYLYFKDSANNNKHVIEIPKTHDLLKSLCLELKIVDTNDSCQTFLTRTEVVHSIRKGYSCYLIYHLIKLFYLRYITSYDENKDISKNFVFIYNLQNGIYNENFDCELSHYYSKSNYPSEDDLISHYKKVSTDNIDYYYSIFNTYNRLFPIFKPKYLTLSKDNLISSIYKDLGVPALHNYLDHYILPLINNITIIDDPSFIYDDYLIYDISNYNIEYFYIENIEDRVIENISKDNRKEKSYVGNELVDKITLLFNGQVIDQQTGDILDFTNDLSLNKNKKKNYKKMITPNPSCIIPLNFWFSKKILPLFLLENTYIEIEIELKEVSRPIGIICEYINISKEEKTVMAKKNTSFVMSFYRYARTAPILNRHDIIVPNGSLIKEIFWKDNELGDYNLKINFDGIERESFKNRNFYKFLTPYYYHIGSSKKYSMYTFSLYPEKNILSGMLNSDRLRTIEFIFDREVQSFNYYILYYGVLEICGGVGLLNI